MIYLRKAISYSVKQGNAHGANIAWQDATQEFPKQEIYCFNLKMYFVSSGRCEIVKFGASTLSLFY